MVGYIRKISKKKWNNKKVIQRKSYCSKTPCVLQSFHNVCFMFSREEIEFMLQCCESNHDGKIDYIGFTDQFHEPAKEIGFNLAVLLTNLSEHMPNEPR